MEILLTKLNGPNFISRTESKASTLSGNIRTAWMLWRYGLPHPRARQHRDSHAKQV
jgi:hypothetical protein